MKIREQYSKEAREVYVVYWADFQGKLERYHCIIPEDGYPGLLSVPESEAELVDANAENFVLVKSNSGKDMLMHPVIAEHNLYYRLVEHDPEAMSQFLNILSSGPPSTSFVRSI